MDKLKGTIYLPIGTKTTDLNNEVRLVRHIHRNLPRKLKISAILDTYVDSEHSACTVEIETLEEKDLNEILSFVKSKIDSYSKNTKVKKELQDVYDFIMKESK